jgi:hypothetical protein
MGRSERSSRPTGILRRDETFTPGGIFTRDGILTRKASQGPVPAASTCTAPTLSRSRLRLRRQVRAGRRSPPERPGA